MTPLEFAKLRAAKYALDKWKLEERVKGNKHEPREVVDRSKPLMHALQVCHICTERKGGLRPFALSAFVKAYRTDLLSAGLNPDSGGEVRCIVSKTRWRTVLALIRLSGGELPPTDEKIARRMEGILTRRKNRAQKELTAGLAEPAADALLQSALNENQL